MNDNTTPTTPKGRPMTSPQVEPTEREANMEAYTAAYMEACRNHPPDHNQIGLHYFRAGWQARASQSAPTPVEDKVDAERWREWLPWMRKLNRKPYGLAMEINRIDRALALEGGAK